MSYPIRKYAALVIALACFASCQDESLLGGDAAGNVKILARMSGSTPTRTCVDGVTTDGSVGILKRRNGKRLVCIFKYECRA